MDDPKSPAEAPSHPVREPSGKGGAGPGGSPALVPLRLVLQPGGPAVELNRPDMLVGRHTDADVRLQLPDVSRRHCRFVFAEGRWQVFDLNSLNGIFVNGIRVRHCLLCHRDQVQIGGCTFEVDLPLGPQEAPSDDRPLTPGQIWGSIANALPRQAPDPVKRQAS